jgi:multidrug efflux system membrane fusion protein
MRIILLLPCVLVTGTTLVVGACAKGEAQPQQQAGGPAATPVTVGPVLRKSMPLEASVVGTVEAYSTVSVRAQITGELTAVRFQQGDDVTEGQELFTLDRRPLEAALLQAEANLERDTARGRERQAIVERYEQLVQRGIVARERATTRAPTSPGSKRRWRRTAPRVENAKCSCNTRRSRRRFPAAPAC